MRRGRGEEGWEGEEGLGVRRVRNRVERVEVGEEEGGRE